MERPYTALLERLEMAPSNGARIEVSLADNYKLMSILSAVGMDKVRAAAEEMDEAWIRVHKDAEKWKFD